MKWFTLIFMMLATQAFGQFRGVDALGGAESIDIPFEYINGHIVMNVYIHGVLPQKMIFDTGAEHTILFNQNTLPFLGYKLGKKIQLLGSDQGNIIDASVCRNVMVRTDNSQIVNRDLLVLEESMSFIDELIGVDIDGILGSSFFYNQIVRINYIKKRITIYNSNYFKPKLKKHKALPIEIIKGKPYIISKYVKPNGDISELKLLIDTGASLSFILNVNESSGVTLPKEYNTAPIGGGMGGVLLGYVGKISSLQVGEFKFENTICYYQNLPDSINYNIVYRDGIIGNGILSKFDIYIDYLHNQLYLKPNKKYSKDILYDRSGLVVFAVGKNHRQYLVQGVLPNTPGSEAGLKKGDLIVSLNRRPKAFLSLYYIYKVFSKNKSRTVRLKVLRKGEKKTLNLTLRDYLKNNIE